MEKLFGIPVGELTAILLGVFAVGLAIIGTVALRHAVVFRVAVRNIPRRRAQTTLIVLGLMLATLLFSASFTTGDTLTQSVRAEGVKRLGQVDVIVGSEARTVSGGPAFFDESYFEQVRRALSDVAEVDSVAPLLRESVPVIAPDSRLSEAQVDILGFDDRWMAGFDRLRGGSGDELSLAALGGAQAYVSEQLARKLEVGPGDVVQVFLGPAPVDLEVASAYRAGASPAGELSVVVPLARLQSLTGEEGRINSVLITNRGDSLAGAQHTAVVLSKLRPALEGSGLEAVPAKRDALDQADEVGNLFASIFLLFGQFSTMAGILLIFLIFVMLAAERKRELGIMRAVGARRAHVVRMFTLEGAVYSLIAAAVGSLLGVLVGWGMVRVMSVAFGQVGLELRYAFNWRSLLMAYTLGMVFTFAVVLVSSWRVSRLNIVRAIRDIPEPRADRKTVKGLVLICLLLAVAVLTALSGFQGGQGSAWMLGTSLIVIGLSLLARRFGMPDRAAFTIAGSGLLAWWLIPVDTLGALGVETQMGIEAFFLSGIMIVLGAVLVTIYNADLLLKAVVFVFGRFRGLPPVLKTAVSYPMQARFRTGVTLAMFSLVVFTLVVMAFILHAAASVYQNTARLSGGFDIRATTSYSNPIIDIRAALENGTRLSADDFDAIGGFSGARVKAIQEGTDQELADTFLQGVDAGYSYNTTYGFAMMSREYNAPGEVWRALENEPGTIIVSSNMVPSRTNLSIGGPTPPVRLEGFWLEDKLLPEVYVRALNPYTGTEHRLRVIGVLENTAVYAQGLLVSRETIDTVLGQNAPQTAYMLRLKEPATAEVATKALKAEFLEHGMQAYAMADEIRKLGSTNLMINNLLQGFMGLGLVVGIAALGVIAARAVVERRQQIGVLRALGFQKGMVQLSFLLESSFVAVLGIALGVALGIATSVQVVNEMTKQLSGVTFQVPWSGIITVVVAAYGASLLTTYLPARQAARVYPAEALRFE